MKKETRQFIMQTIFLILLLMAIITLISTIAILLKNKEIIQTDPLTYGMNQHNFEFCECVDSENKKWYSENGGFVHREYVGSDIIITNISNLEKYFKNTT